MNTYHSVGRVLSNEEEPVGQTKKLKTQEQKITAWKEYSWQEQVVKNVTNEEALQNFLEDPGLTWLMD